MDIYSACKKTIRFKVFDKETSKTRLSPRYISGLNQGARQLADGCFTNESNAVFGVSLQRLYSKKTFQNISKHIIHCIASIVLALLLTSLTSNATDISTQKQYVIDENTSYYITQQTWATPPAGGDTIFISTERTKALRFQYISGSEDNPIVIINYGGQVNIDSPTAWGALTFENCKYIKVSGTGHPCYKYGFLLSAKTCGLAFSELSTDCEAEFIKIDHNGFYGIMAKKNYGGNPPSPVPVFSNLVIHDCFIENVTEGMYLGETTTPGMEFKHVKIYNNIVKNTGRESIQIANMVEDVEIYNNTLLYAGLDNISQQNNILQIGDNSVANVYNNIIIGAPKAGIITMGMGKNVFSNNYIASCKGMFIDNRKVSNENYPIIISGNYFVNNLYNEVILNMNEVNTIVANNNSYNTNIYFFLNKSGIEGNLIFANNNLKELPTITFASPEENDYSLAEGVAEAYANMGAPGGTEYFEAQGDEPGSTSQSGQITLTTDMVVDEVKISGGSIYTPNFLVDEQDCTPKNELHPVSQSWKPYWNMDYGPYYVYFDLQEYYQITKIAFHDMTSTQNLEVWIGEPGDWQLLFTEPCDKYKTWKEHTTNISTKYIRLGMPEGVHAAVNEVILYGYMLNNNKSGKNESETPGNDETFALVNGLYIVQNPVQDKLNVNIPEGLGENFKIEIYNINGKQLIAQSYPESNTSEYFTIDISSKCDKQGIYIMRYSNTQGIRKSVKFMKI